MITPLTAIPQPAPWTPCRYIKRSVTVALTGRPSKPALVPLHDAKHLRPVERPTPLAHPDLVEDDCAHWFQDERWIDQPYSDPPMLISDTTDWPAYPPRVRIGKYGIARCDSFARGFTQAGLSMYTPSIPAPVTFTPNTAPLVAAAQRKEAELLVTIPASADCLHVEPLPAPVVLAPIAPPPCPDEHVIQPVMLIDGKPETVEAQQRRRASCSLVHGTDQLPRKVFYHGKAVEA